MVDGKFQLSEEQGRTCDRVMLERGPRIYLLVQVVVQLRS